MGVRGREKDETKQMSVHRESQNRMMAVREQREDLSGRVERQRNRTDQTSGAEAAGCGAR